MSAAWAVKQYSVVKMGVGVGIVVGTRVLGVLITQEEEEEEVLRCLSEAVSLSKLEEYTHDMTLDIITCKIYVYSETMKEICT